MLRLIQLLTVFYVVVLTLLLEMPSSAREIAVSASQWWEGYEHIITFAGLGFLVELSRVKKSILFWMSVLLLYALATEVLQGLLSPICNRSCNLDDLIQNIVGILLGIPVGYFCRPIIKRSSD
jgi:VanZ family protein